MADSSEYGDRLKESLKAIPPLPGVYLFKDKHNNVIYVGKAKVLRKRVSSYFSRKKFENNKVNVLVRQIRTIDHIVVDTESDALLLENNLIKEYQPRYNVMMKDDKSFPYICIKNERFPRIFSTRNPIKDGSLYYGPYTSVFMVRTILDLIRQIYSLRNCNYNLSQENIASGKFKVCLEYHIGNCLGPCEGKQLADDYDRNIEQIKNILKGNISGVKDFLNSKMQKLAEQYEYEKAHAIKEKIGILERYQSKSTIVNPSIRDLDVFSFIENERYAASNFVKVVNGAVVQSQTIGIKKVLGEDRSELLALVITEIRNRIYTDSSEIVVPFLPGMAIKGVKFIIPKIGDKKRLLDLSTRNAGYYLQEQMKIRLQKKRDADSNSVMVNAMNDLRLDRLPVHMECFDNSNIQGTNPVSACVVFREGKPSKSEYRHYNVKGVKGPDDYSSMKEVISRRYLRLIKENKPLPQLIIVDGGKAQLGAAVNVLESLGLSDKVNVIAIAKRLEEIFFPGDPDPLFIDKKSGTLRLIQHMRNEAHRFSLLFHRQKRSSGFAKSVLESVPGLGKKTVENLYNKFKNLEAIRSAGFDDLKDQIGRSKAEILIEYMKNLKEL